MSQTLIELVRSIKRGEIIPFLGPGALAGVVDPSNQEPIPADSDSLIIGLNHGRPMSPRLMWEFSRAAMNVELKRGRGAVQRFLDQKSKRDGFGDVLLVPRAPAAEAPSDAGLARAVGLLDAELEVGR